MRIVITLFDETQIAYDCKTVGFDYSNHTINLDWIDGFGDEYFKMVPFEKIIYATIYNGGVKDEKRL